MRIEADAPSNIALIKYMGKSDPSVNHPTNSSFSFSLEHLRTRVVLEPTQEASDRWEPLENASALNLSEKGRQRFLKHFEFLKSTLKIPGHYVLRSGNNFPSDCGLASSASSFAALTQAALILGRECSVEKDWVESLSLSERAELSRRGSGSSCRSFVGPFALWTERGVEEVRLPRSNWHHSVIVVEDRQKEISSSEAHKKVTESLLFQGRAERAQVRLQQLLEALQIQNWKRAYEICWSEFWDMHALFETCEPSFGYMTPESLWVLNQIRNFWKSQGDGPLVTMDAGANVHLLYREDQSHMAQAFHREFSNTFKVISSFEGPV